MTLASIIGVMGVLGILAVAVLAFKHVINLGVAVLLWALALSFVLGFYFWMREEDGVYGAGVSGALAGLMDSVLLGVRDVFSVLWDFVSQLW